MESNISDQYSKEHLYERIVQTIEGSGPGSRSLELKNTSVYDEFHVMGRVVTSQLLEQLYLNKDHKVLDVGCGLGGPCRMISSKFGCHSTGLDLSKEHIRSASLLSQSLEMSHLTNFIEGDALNLPFNSCSFDLVITQHVHMNILNKEKFYSEIHRVLKPGGQFLYYDVFGQESESLHYPLPWADNSGANHMLTTPTHYDILSAVGMEESTANPLTAKAIQFLTTFLDRTRVNPSLFNSQKILMGEDAGEKVHNILRCLEEGKIELQSGIWRKRQS